MKSDYYLSFHREKKINISLEIDAVKTENSIGDIFGFTQDITMRKVFFSGVRDFC